MVEVSTKGAAFLRARRPEHKRQRYDAILDAARELATAESVNVVSLAGIAERVGMHKSALLRYFETREEIFLRLAETEWREWADALVAALADTDPTAGPSGSPTRWAGRSATGRCSASSCCTRRSPWSATSPSTSCARFKQAAMGAVDDVADALHRALPGARAGRLLRAAGHDRHRRGRDVAGGQPAARWWSRCTRRSRATVPTCWRPVPRTSRTAVARFVRVYLAGLTSARTDPPGELLRTPAPEPVRALSWRWQDGRGGTATPPPSS